jgi:phosphatidylserine decarboxylase
MHEAVESDPHAYRSFNAFFTRTLRSGARTIAAEADAVISPVDGFVSQIGSIDDDLILQAKGRKYSLQELLGGPERARRYRGGEFACLYLAPHNYHRIHLPVAGELRDTLYVPGDLFSVNAATARAVPRLFARNERVICDFETLAGGMALVMVGALFVGSIETVWAGEINPPRRRRGEPTSIAAGKGMEFPQAAEIGRFNMGSTVILVFERQRIEWLSRITLGTVIRMGERIATIRST